jgi:hypothetical protein
VRNRIIKKKIHVRIEHVRKSQCRKDFLARLKSNEGEARQAKMNKSMWASFFFSSLFFFLLLVPAWSCGLSTIFACLSALD